MYLKLAPPVTVPPWHAVFLTWTGQQRSHPPIFGDSKTWRFNDKFPATFSNQSFLDALLCQKKLKILQLQNVRVPIESIWLSQLAAGNQSHRLQINNLVETISIPGSEYKTSAPKVSSKKLSSFFSFFFFPSPKNFAQKWMSSTYQQRFALGGLPPVLKII